MERSILHVERQYTDALAILHQKVKGEVLDEKVGVMSERLAVEGVKDRVARAVGRGGATVRLASLSKLERLTTEGTLVDLALFCTGEGDAKVFEL